MIVVEENVSISLLSLPQFDIESLIFFKIMRHRFTLIFSISEENDQNDPPTIYKGSI